jgi:hypothetical protein
MVASGDNASIMAISSNFDSVGSVQMRIPYHVPYSFTIRLIANVSARRLIAIIPDTIELLT